MSMTDEQPDPRCITLPPGVIPIAVGDPAGLTPFLAIVHIRAHHALVVGQAFWVVGDIAEALAANGMFTRVN